MAQSVFMTALLCALTVPMIFGGLVSLLTFATSMAIALVVGKIAQKTGAKMAGTVYTGIQSVRCNVFVSIMG